MEKSLQDQMKGKLRHLFGNDGIEANDTRVYKSDEDGLITTAVLKEKENIVKIYIAYKDENKEEGIDLTEPKFVFQIIPSDIARIEESVLACKNDIERMVIDMNLDADSEENLT